MTPPSFAAGFMVAITHIPIQTSHTRRRRDAITVLGGGLHDRPPGVRGRVSDPQPVTPPHQSVPAGEALNPIRPHPHPHRPQLHTLHRDLRQNLRIRRLSFFRAGCPIVVGRVPSDITAHHHPTTVPSPDRIRFRWLRISRPDITHMLKIPLPTINTARNLSLTVIVITPLLPRPPRTPRLRTTRPTRTPRNPHLKLTNTMRLSQNVFL